jgi:Icc-related predicted phosphoesterase
VLIGVVSDTHGMLQDFVVRNGLPTVDVIVIAGDYCPNRRGGGEVEDARFQLDWLKSSFVPFLKTLSVSKIVISAGNHDWCHYIEETKSAAELLVQQAATYLEDTSCTIDGNVFHGSAWTPWFWDWAFNFDRMDPTLGYQQAKKIWGMIPDKVDVLITHGPPFNILDECPDGRRVGCPILRDRILQVRPKIHFFGHIHHSYGSQKTDGIQYANVALCNESYEPVNPIQVFEV